MSATNRGREREERDYYKTPHKSFSPVIQYIKDLNVPVWEPACGDGRLIRWMRDSGVEADGVDISTDIRLDFFLDKQRRQCIATNPPFRLAFEFAKHAVNHADHVFLLLRLNFLASETRHGWFAGHEPALFVLPSRPQFIRAMTCNTVADGESKACGHKWTADIEQPKPSACPVCGGHTLLQSTSDSCEYAWFYWGNRYTGIRHL